MTDPTPTAAPVTSGITRNDIFRYLQATLENRGYSLSVMLIGEMTDYINQRWVRSTAAPPPSPAPDGLEARVDALEKSRSLHFRTFSDAFDLVKETTDAHNAALAEERTQRMLQAGVTTESIVHINTRLRDIDAALAELRRRLDQHYHLYDDGSTSKPIPTPPCRPVPEGGGVWASFLGEPVPDPAPDDTTERPATDDERTAMGVRDLGLSSDLDARRVRDFEALVIAEAEAEDAVEDERKWGEVAVAHDLAYAKANNYEDDYRPASSIAGAKAAVAKAAEIGLIPSSALTVTDELVRRCHEHAARHWTAAGQGATDDR